MTDLTHKWHQPKVEPFDYPEFYEQGDVVTITAPDGWFISVSSDGKRYLEVYDAERGAGTRLESAEEFRAAFPDGAIPDEGDGYRWVNNGWFDLYVTGGDQLSELDGEDGVAYSLAEAVDDAERRLGEREKRKDDAAQIRKMNADAPATWPSQQWIDYGREGN